MMRNSIFDLENGGSTYTQVNMVLYSDFQLSRPIDPHNDRLPVGFINQLVEHCTHGIAEVQVKG